MTSFLSERSDKRKGDKGFEKEWEGSEGVEGTEGGGQHGHHWGEPGTGRDLHECHGRAKPLVHGQANSSENISESANSFANISGSAKH